MVERQGFYQWIVYIDVVSYLPDDILVKLDQASTGVSLEARVPLLVPRLVEFAQTRTPSMKICYGKGKRILSQVLDREVLEELVVHSRMGLGVPIRIWLRGLSRERAEDLLVAKRSQQEEGFLVHTQSRRSGRSIYRGGATGSSGSGTF